MASELESFQPPLPATSPVDRGLGPISAHHSMSPARAFLIVTVALLLAELISAIYGERFISRLGLYHELMDASLILAVTVPSLYYFFAVPMRQALEEKAAAQDSLQDLCFDLDNQVRARTAELESLNESLRVSQAHYGSVVENSPTGIFILRGHHIVFGNARFYEMIGLPKYEGPELDATRFLVPAEFARIDLLLKRRYAGDRSGDDIDSQLVTSVGETRWIRGRTVLIDFHGEPALLGNIQDITERHESEKNLRESREALRQLSARLLTVQEEERKRIAQDLHDGIGQSLTAVKFMVEKAVGDSSGQLEGSRKELLQNVVPVIQHCVAEVRNICMALRPSILDDLGLIATLQWFCREFHKVYPQVQVDVEIGIEEAQIPEALKTNIFRIVQESLNNVAKHANAERVLVGLNWSNQAELALTVRDDGVGIEPGVAGVRNRTGGFGLASMRERAECTDGNLRIDSAPGEGTTINVKWPLINSPEFIQLFYPRAK
jgi:PAS domain S-box-containing protein